MLAYNTRIPTPPGATFESTADSLYNDPVNFVTNLVNTYGDIVHLPFGERELYLVNNPSYVRELFIGKPEFFGKRQDEAAEQSYLDQIAGFVPLFDPANTPKYIPIVSAAVSRADQRWLAGYSQSDPFVVNMHKEIMQITLEIVAELLYQANIQADSASLVDDILTLDFGYGFDPIGANLGAIMPPRVITESEASKEARARLLAAFRRVVDEHSYSEGTFLSGLKNALGAETAANVALSIALSMHEVTATTLTWTWCLLAQNPEAEARLHAELAATQQGRPVSYEDALNLPYTSMALDEARRLYPSVWIIARYARSDVSLGEYTIPANAIVLASQWLLHHDARFFPDPYKFDPQRWTAEAQAQLPEFAYFPFSAGPRQCAGLWFAPAQDVVVLGTLAQRWQARLEEGQVLEPIQWRSSIPRYGIQMRLIKRAE